MKKYFFFLVFFLLSFFVFSQPYHPFPTDSAQWSIRHTHAPPFSQDSWQLKMKGDTMLNGITYHKMFYSLDLFYGSPNETLHCFVREDTAKKVFAKYPVGVAMDTTEFMLYDFNISVGDTLTLRLLNNSVDSTFKASVDGTGPYATIIDTRTGYNLSPVAPFGPMWGGCDLNFEWIDGIGCVLGLLYNEIPSGGCIDDDYEISCFWERGIYVGGGTFCDYNTGVDNLHQNDYSLSAFPNPVTDISYINIEGKDFERIEIYNILGVQVGKPDIHNLSKIILSKKDFTEGIYICKIFSEDEKCYTSIFIVQ
jgi:hypothetical protein